MAIDGSSIGRSLRHCLSGCVFLAASGLLVACRSESPPASVVLIVLDTVRSDRLSVYGYPRPTSPTLERFAAEAAVFESAWSTSSWTSSAHASLFTGLYPCTHGCTQESWRLPTRLETLAESLQRAGFATAGFVENPMLRRGLGFAQGFDEYHHLWGDLDEQENDEPTVARFREFAGNREEPFFAFINLIGAHSPYDWHEAYSPQFVSDSTIPIDRNHWQEYFTGRRDLSAQEIGHLSDRYDAEIRRVDETLQRLLSRIDELPTERRVCVFVVGDHGEHFGERGMVDHVFSLSDQLLKIPLLARCPGVFEPGSRVETPVQILDLYSTILEIVGIPVPRANQGRSLLTPGDDSQRLLLFQYGYPRQALEAIGEPYSESPLLDRFRRRLVAVRKGNAVFELGSDGRSSFRVDGIGDVSPERTSEEAELGSRARDLRRSLSAILRMRCPETPLKLDVIRGLEGIDAETKKALEALGYL